MYQLYTLTEWKMVHKVILTDNHILTANATEWIVSNDPVNVSIDLLLYIDSIINLSIMYWVQGINLIMHLGKDGGIRGEHVSWMLPLSFEASLSFLFQSQRFCS